MIEVRTVEGSADEAARFINEVWSALQGDSVVQRFSSELLTWQFGRGERSRELWVAAYEGAAPIGILLHQALPFRVDEREVNGSVGSCLTVHPDYRGRGVGDLIFNEARRRLRERDIALGYGFMDTGPAASRFWHRQPRSVSLGFHRWWSRIINARAMANWTLYPSQRLWLQALAHVQVPPRAPSPEHVIRNVRKDDIDFCVNLVRSLDDVAIAWDTASLGPQLCGDGPCRTLVYERDGRPAGFINYWHSEEIGRCSGLAANIDLLAVQGLRREERRALIDAALVRMNEEGVISASILGLPGHSPRMLFENGFWPYARDVEVRSLIEASEIDLSRVRGINLVYR